jgi:uncharacterized protein
VDPHAVTTVEQLREIYPPPRERSLRKVVERLDEHCRRFISLSPLLLIATADPQGGCEVSPRGGPPGFVRVLDDHRLLIPDATGNRRLDSLQNMIRNPRVGTLFLIPGMGETLRVNGSVALSRDPELLAGLQTGGGPARLALILTVECAHLHCAKALIRSRLWRADTWPPTDELPSAAEILNDHIGLGDLAASAAALEESYRHRL